MKTQTTFRRPKREMMLHTITGKNLHRTVVTMNRQRHNHRAFRKFQPLAVSLQNLQTVGDEIELLAGHVESRVIVDFHEARVALVRVRSTKPTLRFEMPPPSLN